MPDVYSIALVQMKMEANPAANVEKAVAQIEQAARDGARLVCLPELFHSLYFCQREDPAFFELAEPIPGPCTQALAAVAARCSVVVVATIFERRGPGMYHNTAVVLDADGSLKGLYRKMHIPDDPGYYEKYYFAPGDLGFRVVDTSLGRIGVLICWDQWFPEAARLMALQGAGLILYPTAIGWHPHEKATLGERQRDAWRTVQRGHAVANGIYVAAINRVGHERPEPSAPGLEFWGSSFLADPQGVVLAEASDGREERLMGLVDMKALEAIRRGWPFLRDRRVDAYDPLLERYMGEAPC